MIHKIFQDLDECLISTSYNTKPLMPHETMILGDDYYYTVIRKCAAELFQFYNSIVGKDNVYILTTSTTDYAREVNRLGNFQVDHSHILARENIRIMNDDHADQNYSDLFNSKNVLIDNLPYHHNFSKTRIVGIKPENYLRTSDFYHYDENAISDDEFLTKVKEFINQRI